MFVINEWNLLNFYWTIFAFNDLLYFILFFIIKILINMEFYYTTMFKI